MARPRKHRPEPKTCTVLVRLTPDQHADLTRLAQREGMTLPDVLRAGLTLIQMTETSRGA